MRVATHYGYYKGQKLLEWLEEGMKMHQRSDSTFADLHNAGCREMRVFACNLNKRNATEFSYRKTPYVKVVYAVRASMGAPLFFEAWQFPDGKPDNDIYVDGGTVLNYPINAFDQHGEVDDSTVGFHLDNLSGDEHLNDLKRDELTKYITVLFDAVVYAQVIGFNHNPEAVAHSVKIDDFGISASKFHLTEEDQKNLYDSGMKYTDQYIKEHDLVGKYGRASSTSAS